MKKFSFPLEAALTIVFSKKSKTIPSVLLWPHKSCPKCYVKLMWFGRIDDFSNDLGGYHTFQNFPNDFKVVNPASSASTSFKSKTDSYPLVVFCFCLQSCALIGAICEFCQRSCFWSGGWMHGSWLATQCCGPCILSTDVLWIGNRLISSCWSWFSCLTSSIWFWNLLDFLQKSLHQESGEIWVLLSGKCSLTWCFQKVRQVLVTASSHVILSTFWKNLEKSRTLGQKTYL